MRRGCVQGIRGKVPQITLRSALVEVIGEVMHVDVVVTVAVVVVMMVVGKMILTIVKRRLLGKRLSTMQASSLNEHETTLPATDSLVPDSSSLAH